MQLRPSAAEQFALAFQWKAANPVSRSAPYQIPVEALASWHELCGDMPEVDTKKSFGGIDESP
jgi:hypothetical protein